MAWGIFLRLPLGVNRKTGQAGRFIRFVGKPTQFTEMSPELALTGTLPWQE